MSYKVINDILDDTLATVPSVPTIVKENEEVTRKKNPSNNPYTKIYLRTSFQPVETDITTIGIKGFDLYQGLYSIQVNVPYEDGTNGMNKLTDAIIGVFPKGTLVTSGSPQITLRIDNVWQSSPINESSNWLVKPIFVSWHSHIQRAE